MSPQKRRQWPCWHSTVPTLSSTLLLGTPESPCSQGPGPADAASEHRSTGLGLTRTPTRQCICQPPLGTQTAAAWASPTAVVGPGPQAPVAGQAAHIWSPLCSRATPPKAMSSQAPTLPQAPQALWPPSLPQLAPTGHPPPRTAVSKTLKDELSVGLVPHTDCILRNSSSSQEKLASLVLERLPCVPRAPLNIMSELFTQGKEHTSSPRPAFCPPHLFFSPCCSGSLTSMPLLLPYLRPRHPLLLTHPNTTLAPGTHWE